MNLPRLLLPAALLLLAISSARLRADEVSDLRKRLEAAEEKIKKLEEGNASRPDPTSLKDAIEDYLKHDAASAPAGAGSTGYDDGFFLRSADGKYLLRFNGHFQFRFVSNHQEETLGDPERHGFENTRTKLLLTGHVVSPAWTYRIESDFDFDGGRLTLRDAHLAYDFGNGWGIQVGQCKCPVLREERVDSAYQLAVERSNVNDVLTSGERFGGGVAVWYAATQWRAIGMFSDGDGTPNMPALAFDTEYALTMRAEWMLRGQWSQFDDFTSFPGHAPALMIGFNAHTQKGESGTAAVEPSALLLAVDVSAEFDGANAFAEFIYVNLETSSIDGTRDLFGVVIHGGYFVTEKIEAFGRYEWATLDDPTSISDEISILTLGANWYIERHKIKVTADAAYAFEAVPAAGRYSGFRMDTPFGAGQVVFRMQLQFLF